MYLVQPILVFPLEKTLLFITGKKKKGFKKFILFCFLLDKENENETCLGKAAL